MIPNLRNIEEVVDGNYMFFGDNKWAIYTKTDGDWQLKFNAGDSNKISDNPYLSDFQSFMPLENVAPYDLVTKDELIDGEQYLVRTRISGCIYGDWQTMYWSKNGSFGMMNPFNRSILIGQVPDFKEVQVVKNQFIDFPKYKNELYEIINEQSTFTFNFKQGTVPLPQCLLDDPDLLAHVRELNEKTRQKLILLSPDEIIKLYLNPLKDA